MSRWHLMGIHWADTWRVSTELSGIPFQVSTDLSGWPWLVSTELQWTLELKVYPVAVCLMVNNLQGRNENLQFVAVGAYKIPNTSRPQLITLEAMLSTKWPLHLLPYVVKHSEINRDSSHTVVALYTWHFFTPLHQLVYTAEYSNFTIYTVS